MPYFDAKDVAAVLTDLLESLDSRLFVAGAPPRPRSLELEPSPETPRMATSTGQALIGGAFQIPPIHVPNAGDGTHARHAYKSELVLVRDPAVGTKKILWWHDKDPRAIPHNHPWDFRSAILAGGYTEERFWVDEAGQLQTETKEYNPGDINVVPADMYHNVIAVKKGTVTYLDCGPARAGNEWGYLDPETLTYKTFKELVSPNFIEIFHSLNTHTRK